MNSGSINLIFDNFKKLNDDKKHEDILELIKDVPDEITLKDKDIFNSFLVKKEIERNKPKPRSTIF